MVMRYDFIFILIFMDALSFFVDHVLIRDVIPFCDIPTIVNLICVSNHLRNILDREHLWKERFSTLWTITIDRDHEFMIKFGSFRETFISVYLWGIVAPILTFKHFRFVLEKEGGL
jgi:hypothetical protein